MTEEQEIEAQTDVPLPYTLRQLSTTGLTALVGVVAKPLDELALVLAQATLAMCPSLTLESAQAMYAAAIQEAAIKHPDFTAHTEGMLIAALGVLPYPYRVGWSEFVESLYVIAKHADFMQTARWRSLLTTESTGAHIQ